MIDFRLEAIPEMNYDPLGSPPRGEVCIRGSTVFTGYYKQEDKTLEVLDSNGWFHTGDVGEILPNGALRIFDRKKNIFKLSQGMLGLQVHSMSHTLIGLVLLLPISMETLPFIIQHLLDTRT